MHSDMKLAHNSPLRITNKKNLSLFTNRFGIDINGGNKNQLLRTICRAFAHIPFENLTKIVKSDLIVAAEQKKRLPDEVIRDSLSLGTGGTCFSLNAAFISLLSRCGFEAYPLLCDRHYGPDTHCAVLLVIDKKFHVVDPGYLMYEPIALPAEVALTTSNGFNTLELVPAAGGEKVELYTIVNNQRRYRLTYKASIVDELTFLRAWETSFSFSMMTYPVVTFCKDGIHYYLQGNVLRKRFESKIERKILTPKGQYGFIVNYSGIHSKIFKEVFNVVDYGANTRSFRG